MLVLHTATGLAAMATADRVKERLAMARGAALRPKADAEASNDMVAAVRNMMARQRANSRIRDLNNDSLLWGNKNKKRGTDQIKQRSLPELAQIE
jgi:histidine ammonia-lyase